MDQIEREELLINAKEGEELSKLIEQTMVSLHYSSSLFSSAFFVVVFWVVFFLIQSKLHDNPAV